MVERGQRAATEGSCGSTVISSGCPRAFVWGRSEEEEEEEEAGQNLQAN